MQYGVLDAPDVLVHGHPIVGTLIDHARRVRTAVTHVIPGRVDKRVHRVSFAPCRPAALRTRTGEEPLILVQRIAGAIRHQILRQDDWQVLLRRGYGPARVAMDDRYRCAPVTLA